LVIIDVQARRILRQQRWYIRPTRNPALSSFCMELTGITQATVDGAEPFEVVFPLVQSYLDKFLASINPTSSFTFVTCGDWDLNTMLKSQLSISRINFKSTLPSYWRRWINIQNIFQDITGGHTRDMKEMLSALGIPLVGRHHCGLDDCLNIASIALRLIRDSLASRHYMPIKIYNKFINS
jgi:inhibitor of KinA sporulation pathway (predicted exonuclease)